MLNKLQLEYWPIDRLTHYVRNPRKNDQVIDKIVASLKEFGFAVPVLAKSDGTVIDGHLRLKGATKLGITEVPVVICDGWSDAQVKSFRLLANRSVSWADWDNELLSLELQDLKLEDFDLSLTGFDAEEISELLAFGYGTEGLTDEDEVPEPPVEPVAVLGDLWILGRHRLLCGDSTSIDAVERLMDGEKADMVFTDPPYGVNYDGGHAVKGVRREKLRNDESADIYAGFLSCAFVASKDTAALYLWFSDSKSAAVTAAVTAAGYEIRNTLIWNKNLAQFGAIGAQYKSKHEPCLYCFKSGSAPFWNGPTNEVSVWDVKREQKNEFHPTQKPVELSVRAMGNSSNANDIVLDFFGGSGSTLIGCEKEGRSGRLMELNPTYCDVIIKRWSDFTGQDPMREDGAKWSELAPKA